MERDYSKIEEIANTKYAFALLKDEAKWVLIDKETKQIILSVWSKNKPKYIEKGFIFDGVIVDEHGTVIK